MPNLVCVSPECDNALPKGKRKYCSDTCKWREQKRVHRNAKQNREYKPEVKKVYNIIRKPTGPGKNPIFVYHDQ